MSPPGAGGPPEKRIVGSMGMDIEDDDDDDDDDDVSHTFNIKRKLPKLKKLQD